MGTPVTQFGAGAFGLAKVTFSQQVRSFVINRFKSDKMMLMPSDIVEWIPAASAFSSSIRIGLPNSFPILPFIRS
jgi:hypothetical protein